MPTPTSIATAAADAFLPWQIIDGGMKDRFFRTELDKSVRAEWTIAAEAGSAILGTDFAAPTSHTAVASSASCSL